MYYVRPFARLCLLLLVGSLLATTGWHMPAPPVAAAPQGGSQPATITYTPLPALGESEPNDTLSKTADQSDPIGPAAGGPLNWSRVVSGTLSRSGDVDYFSFEVPPASTVAISLTNLSADYDLVLAGASTGEEDGLGGLSNIIDTGGSIAAIGGSIAAIGGSIAAIGGSIAAISANSGTTNESVETFLWQPGRYYVVVSSSDGGSSSLPYTLEVRLAGSPLTQPPPAPEVEFAPVANGNTVDTLFLINKQRMLTLYPGESAAIDQVISATEQLANLYNGAVVDMSTLEASGTTSETLRSIYQRWDDNPGNPLEANRVVRFIDNVIKSASRQNPSGPNPLFIANAQTNLAQRASAPAQGSLPVPLPNLRNVVLVGGDNVFPFFRTPDLTTIANEGEYADYLKQIDSGGIIDPNTPLGAALKYRTMLSDNIYGAGRPYRFLGHPLFVPRLAVGRLVETPKDIYAYLKPYVVANPACGNAPCQPEVDMNDLTRIDRAGFVAGYDFLTDMADDVRQQFNTVGLPRVSTLINDNWTAKDLTDSWFDGRYDDFVGRTTYTTSGTFGLNSINAHFDHWRIIPASSGAGFVDAQNIYRPQVDTGLNRTPFFARQLIASVGCHSGYSVLDGAIVASTPNRSLYQADFPQAILKQGGMLVANLGYGYGSLDSIDYSERLATLFHQELGRDVRGARNVYIGNDVGRALMVAKQRYLRNATSLSVYDAKSLQVMTLFGLPFARVRVPTPQQPTPEERADAPALRLTPRTAAGPLGSFERIVTFTITIDNKALGRRGTSIGSVPNISGIGVEDSFLSPTSTTTPTIRIFSANQIGRPTLPQFAYDITTLSALDTTRQLIVRDVSFVGGVYSLQTGYNPVITQVTTETDSILSFTSVEPAFTAGANIWYPDRFYGHTSVGEGDENRDQLVVSAAQFRADSSGQSGAMRPYKQMVFKIRYTDPAASTAQPALNDRTAPVIEAVTLFGQEGTTSVQQTSITASQIEVKVRDGDGETGVGSVEGVYITRVNGEDTWQHIVFTQDRLSGGSLQRWFANVPLAPGAVRVIVTANDRAGNATTYTAKGTFAPPIGRLVYAPMIWR
jgi:hypothetical protein